MARMVGQSIPKGYSSLQELKLGKNTLENRLKNHEMLKPTRTSISYNFNFAYVIIMKYFANVTEKKVIFKTK